MHHLGLGLGEAKGGEAQEAAFFFAAALWALPQERMELWCSSGLGQWLVLTEPPTLNPQSGHGSSCPGTYARPSRRGLGSL